MKKNEIFNPTIQSSTAPIGIIFRSANRQDSTTINRLMVERNPSTDLAQISSNTNRELDRVESDPNYNLFVAELNHEIVGLCRFYHSSGLPSQKKIYPSPEGWYGMGIMVDSKFRRQNIARFISLSRLEVLKKMGVKEFYSIVDSSNLTSMHASRIWLSRSRSS